MGVSVAGTVVGVAVVGLLFGEGVLDKVLSLCRCAVLRVACSTSRLTTDCRTRTTASVGLSACTRPGQKAAVGGRRSGWMARGKRSLEARWEPLEPLEPWEESPRCLPKAQALVGRARDKTRASQDAAKWKRWGACNKFPSSIPSRTTTTKKKGLAATCKLDEKQSRMQNKSKTTSTSTSNRKTGLPLERAAEARGCQEAGWPSPNGWDGRARVQPPHAT